MRILHLGKFCPPFEGGIEIFTHDLLEHLNSKGIKADLICFSRESKKGDFYRSFEFHACKTNIVFKSAPLSFDFVKTYMYIEKNYDIIHVHSPNPLAEILATLSPKKVIIHWHSDIVRQKILYKLYKPLQQLALKKASKIICTSNNYLETSEQIRNFRDKAVVIPLGLNPRRLEDSEKNEEINLDLEKYKDKKIVLSIGRLVEYKGFEYLIEAGKYLDDNFIILIVGYGPLFNKLKQKIIDLNLQDKVYLLGRIDNNNIDKLLKNCDIFVLPSILRTESFGLVSVEALYFGKPLITTNVSGSGMNYVNQDGVTGFVVPPRDPTAIADAIKKICFDRELYLKFSKNAKERFSEFNIQNIGESIIRLYKEVLNAN